MEILLILGLGLVGGGFYLYLRRQNSLKRFDYLFSQNHKD